MSENNQQNGENSNLFGLNSKSIQQDLLYFKNDLLKELRQIDTKLINKYSMTDSLITKKMEEFESRIQVCVSKVAELSNLIVTDRTIREKVDSLIKFKEKTDETIMTHDIQLTNLYKDSHNSIDRIDQVLNDSVLYPGVIGNMCRFKNFHECIDFMLSNVAELNSFKDKNTMDLKDYKKYLDSTIQSFKLQINNFMSNSNQFTTTSVNASEERMKNMMKIYDDRLQDSRIENARYSVKIEREFEAMKKDWEKIVRIKQEINDNLSRSEKNMREDTAKIADMFLNYKQEFKVIKARFIQLSEFLKDVRFRINLQNELKKKQYLEMSNFMDFRQKQRLDESASYMDSVNRPFADSNSNTNKKLLRQNTVSCDRKPPKFNPEKSYIKQYINGEITATDLNNIRELKENIHTIKEREFDDIDKDLRTVEEFKGKQKLIERKLSLKNEGRPKPMMKRLTTFNLNHVDVFNNTLGNNRSGGSNSNSRYSGYQSKYTKNLEFDLDNLYDLFDLDLEKKPAVNKKFSTRNSMKIASNPINKLLESSKDASLRKSAEKENSLLKSLSKNLKSKSSNKIEDIDEKSENEEEKEREEEEVTTRIRNVNFVKMNEEIGDGEEKKEVKINAFLSI